MHCGVTKIHWPGRGSLRCRLMRLARIADSKPIDCLVGILERLAEYHFTVDSQHAYHGYKETVDTVGDSTSPSQEYEAR